MKRHNTTHAIIHTGKLPKALEKGLKKHPGPWIYLPQINQKNHTRRSSDFCRNRGRWDRQWVRDRSDIFFGVFPQCPVDSE